MNLKIEPKNNCPLDGFKPCRQLECGWFTQMRGTNPNTGEAVDSWGCAVTWLPMLLVENASQSRQTGASVESFRNEMVRANQASLELLTGEVNARINNSK